MSYLNNQLLIAMPSLDDPNFDHTVTYICEHNDEGALGIVISREVGVPLEDILSQLEIVSDAPLRSRVLAGGPVQTDHGFVLHGKCDVAFEATLPVSDDIYLTASSDVLAAIAQGCGPDQYLVALGYAGWSAGQLEEEMAENVWLNAPATTKIIFDMPLEQRWQAAADSLGFDINLLTSEAGHA